MQWALQGLKAIAKYLWWFITDFGDKYILEPRENEDTEAEVI